MEFSRPEHLWWIAALPAVFALWRLSNRNTSKVRRQFEDFLKVARVSRVTTRGHEVGRALVLLAAVGALIVAVAEPRLELERTQPIYMKQDVVLMLDASLSMLARDVHPSRMVRAQEEIRNFIVERGSLIDRIGLVTFAGTSVITSYMTTDPRNILFYLEFMDVVPRISYGTNIGAALSNAMTLVETEDAAAERAGRSVESQDVFLLLADGEDYGEGLDQALNAIVAADIPVHAVGIGTEADATIPIQVEGEEYLLADEDGDLVSAQFDESSLRRIAAVTGGSYFRSYSGAELSRTVAQFLERGRRVVGQEVIVERVDLYPHFTAVGAILLAAFLLI